jgi:glycerophosphoryl diester phosphodiesterase
VVPVAIQCFDSQALIYLKTVTAIPLVYLFTPAHTAAFNHDGGDGGLGDFDLSDAHLAAIATYAEAVGPSKGMLHLLARGLARSETLSLDNSTLGRDESNILAVAF